MIAKPMIVANWKMQVDIDASMTMARALVEVYVANRQAYSLVLCPSFVNIPGVSKALLHTEIGLGAQDVGSINRGARTGDVSVLDLHTLGCAYCIVGHSERRLYHGEIDEQVHEKVLTCVRLGIVPVVCVGETRNERSEQKTQAVVTRQLRAALSDVPMGPKTRILIAYEPVWSISPGTPAVPEQVEEVFVLIRNEVRESAIPAPLVKVLYGGSVNSSTVSGFMNYTSADGFLVGSESQEPARFISLLNTITLIQRRVESQTR